MQTPNYKHLMFFPGTEKEKNDEFRWRLITFHELISECDKWDRSNRGNDHEPLSANILGTSKSRHNICLLSC